MSLQGYAAIRSLLLISIGIVAITGCGTEARHAAESVGADASIGGLSGSTENHQLPMLRPLAGLATAEGTSAAEELNNDQHDAIVETPFQMVLANPLSTFSIDVDTASYSKVRQHLLGYGRLPRPSAVRIEELLNYFPYDYSPPSQDNSAPFATHISITQAPWNENHRLARIALKGRIIENEQRPPSNLVFLVDTSGSMKRPNKLPLLRQSLGILLEQLGKNDRIAIVAYAGSAGVVLPSTPATQTRKIIDHFSQLNASGSTNGSAGLQLAYKIAKENFIDEGTNRVLLCTDGDFNVGQTSDDQLISMVASNAKSGVELSVLGFGMGNLNDAMLEQVSGIGNGNYAFIDTHNEANKVLKEQLSGTLVTIAKDVKIQVEFNPANVAAYRLIGYENRMLASRDFNNDKKDAGEIGAGHSVTALYEIIPTGVTMSDHIATVDSLKYQQSPRQTPDANSNELLTLKLRYKFPGDETSQLMEQAVADSNASFDDADNDFRFAAAVAGFGMQLRQSDHRGDWPYDAIRRTATSALGSDQHGFRKEFVKLVCAAEQLSEQNQ
jgi:Ca-activated chloride channel family protein